MLTQLFLSTFVFFLSTQAIVRYPIVLVPGDGGSQFFAKLNKSEAPHYFCEKVSDWFSLWLNLYELAPLVLDCFVDNMRLQYDNVTRTTHDAHGVMLDIPGFGNTSTVEWLDPSRISATSYFAPIADALVSWGYVRGESIRGVPYDFRKAPNEMGPLFVRVKNLVEETYVMNNNSRVILLAHSMGNPMSLYFLNRQTVAWKDKYIRSMITLAGVWGGAIKPLRLMASGDSLGVLFVNPLAVRPEQRSMPSTAWLMPSDKFWNASEVLVSAPHANYTVNDYKKFFDDIEYPTGYMMREDTENLITDLVAPGVEVHCLHGHGVPTPKKFIYNTKSWYDKQPISTSDDGDGTVNIRSLQGCLRWVGEQKQPVYHYEFFKAEHMEILKRGDVIAYIKTVVSSD